MGSNMAECHPVGFQWVMEAKLRGAKIVHVDPRFTRTSALASSYVPIRAGSDIAFLGGIVNHILQNGREFRDYVVNYTNAPVIINEDFKDTEDLDGFFSGWDEEKGGYDNTTWQYAGMRVRGAVQDEETALSGEAVGYGGHGAGLEHGEPPEEDPTLEHPRCVFQLLKRHYSRYTPERVAEICGCSKEQFLEVAEALCENSGRERTSAFCYAVGWTQHTIGVQIIRTAAIIQLLLGNMGRTGGGIMALRGHASIQGSTDIPTLFNILPGYIPMAHAHAKQTLAEFVEKNASPTGWWGRLDAYMVSLLKAYFGARATAENDFCFDYLPRIDGDHSTYQAALGMLEGKVKGFFLFGENPAVGSANSRLHRMAMANLDWLVVRDLVEIESASFWHDAPELETGELKTERDTDRGLPAPGRLARREERIVHEHPAAAAVALQGGRAIGRLPLRPLVRLPPRTADPREARATRTTRATGRCSTSNGTTRPRGRSRIRAPTLCCARSAAGTRTGAPSRASPS